MKNLIFIFLVFPLFIQAQEKSSWKLYNGCKKVLEGVVGEKKEYIISTKQSSNLTLKYYPNADRKNWNNTFIVMDSTRTELLRNPSSNNKLKLTKEFINNSKDLGYFIINIVSKPNDPILASKIRVGTVALLKMVYKN